jgi:hypothetical protein
MAAMASCSWNSLFYHVSYHPEATGLIEPLLTTQLQHQLCGNNIAGLGWL